MNLIAYSKHKTIEDMETSTQNHIYYKGLKDGVKSVLICLKEYGKLNMGVSKVKADTIAEKTKTSRSTVMRSIKKLEELKVIEKINCVKLNGIKGASIYSILPFDDTSRMTQRDTSEEVSNDAVCEVKKNTEYINSLISFKTSTLKEIYSYAYENEMYLNDFQKQLLQLMNSFKIDKVLNDELYKVIVATEINSVQDFHIAKDIIFNIANDIQSGRLSVDTTVRAIYKGAYKAKIKRMESPKKSDNVIVAEIEQTASERPVKFYNWLDDRGDDIDCFSEEQTLSFEEQKKLILAKIGQ